MKKNKYLCDCNIIHSEIVNEVSKKMLSNELFDKVSKFFKILGDNTRIKILFALLNNKMCVCDIANLLNMSKSSISHQLSILKKNEIVKCNKDGKVVYYSLNDNHINQLIKIGVEHNEEI